MISSAPGGCGGDGNGGRKVPVRRFSISEDDLNMVERFRNMRIGTQAAWSSQYGDNESAIDDASDLSDAHVDHLCAQNTQRHTNKKEQMKQPFEGVMPFPMAPLLTTLTPRDFGSVMALLDAAFSNGVIKPSREQIEYHLTIGSGMCMGLFCTIGPEQAEKMNWKPETMDTAHHAETGRQKGAKLVLLACVIGSRIHGDRITANAVTVPSHWRTNPNMASTMGHQISGRSVAIHCVAVLPKLHRRKLGRLIVRAYNQNMTIAGNGDLSLVRCPNIIRPFFEGMFYEAKPEPAENIGVTGATDMFLVLPNAMNSRELLKHQQQRGGENFEQVWV